MNEGNPYGMAQMQWGNHVDGERHSASARYLTAGAAPAQLTVVRRPRRPR